MSDMTASNMTQIPKPKSAPSCVHHWLLEDPSHGMVRGTCRRCNVVKQFPGTPDGSYRFDDYRELTSASTYYEAGRSA